MPETKRSFIGGIMNKDVDERLVPDGQIIEGRNIDIVASEGTDAGTARNRKGNEKIGDLSNVAGQPVDSSTKCIGVTKSESKNLIFYLISSDYFDGIYEFNEINGVISRVVQSNKATPSSITKLAFDPDYYVTGINYIDGFLCWTDNLNEPCRVNVGRAKSYNIDDDRIDRDLKVVRTPPLNPPMIDLIDELEQENNMKERFLQFAVRFKYRDDQYSAFSPFSGTAFAPDDYFLDYGAGENKAMLNTKNKVSISFPTGDDFVEEIELLMRDSKDINISVVESFNKEQLNIPDNGIWDFEFANNKVYRVLPQAQLTRLFDNVPIKAKSQEVIDSRIVYGNYVQFYDITDDNSNDILIDYKVSYVSKDTTVETPIQTFRSDRDMEIGIIYGEDTGGRFSTVLTSETNTTYIPPQQSITGNSLTVEISNDPPAFATHYRMVIKQSKKDYYNIFPILYYADGLYRYFLVNDFDKDKIRVGEYVIFKSDYSGPTLSNKKYKILEFEQKGSNFLGVGNSTNEIAGLYFKIKVDDSSEFSPAGLFVHSSSAYGTNRLLGDDSSLGLSGSALPFQFTPFGPVTPFNYTEDPIYYGDNNGDILSVVNNDFFGDKDLRCTIEITSSNEFKYTFDITGSTGFTTNVPILPSSTTAISYSGVVVFNIVWSNQNVYHIGDKWKVNCRHGGHLTGNYFGGVGVPNPFIASNTGDWGGAAIIPENSWYESSTTFPGVPVDREIKAGAVVRLNIIEDRYNSAGQAGVQQFPPSPRTYANIEEWFVESGAYSTFVFNESVSSGGGSVTNVGPRAITFRRGIRSTNPYNINFCSINGTLHDLSGYASGVQIQKILPVHMIIQGYGVDDGVNFLADCGRKANEIRVSIDIQQAENPTLCETEPLETDVDIFHETRTYPIEGGKHKVLWDYQDFTNPAYATVDGTNYTNIGQLIPGDTPDGISPHYFQVGDEVQVTSNNIVGQYTIVYIEDKYNIVIDYPWPGSGPTTAGSVGFYHEDFEEADQAFTPARLLINPTTNTNSVFNAYAFGNGLETDRIRDNFNSTTLEYSPRTYTAIEDYKQERKSNHLTYSGLYRADTSVNRLNEFNLSQSNFKRLDREFGTVQKLHARDTDLIVFQEDKVSQVLYGKNILTDAVGGGTVTSVPEVLGTQTAFVGEWGIGTNPESFAEWNNVLYFTDTIRGAVLKFTSGGIYDISEEGMKSYFRDEFKASPNTKKLGVYDPHNQYYIIASNEDPSIQCDLKIKPTYKDYPADIDEDTIQTTNNNPDFKIVSNTSWTTSIVYSAGSGWVTGVPASGFGDQNISLGISDNTTGVTRTAEITITYCGGLTQVFTVNQGAGQVIQVITWISNNSNI